MSKITHSTAVFHLRSLEQGYQYSVVLYSPIKIDHLSSIWTKKLWKSNELMDSCVKQGKQQPFRLLTHMACRDITLHARISISQKFPDIFASSVSTKRDQRLCTFALPAMKVSSHCCISTKCVWRCLVTGIDSNMDVADDTVWSELQSKIYCCCCCCRNNV